MTFENDGRIMGKHVREEKGEGGKLKYRRLQTPSGTKEGTPPANHPQVNSRPARRSPLSFTATRSNPPSTGTPTQLVHLQTHGANTPRCRSAGAKHTILVDIRMHMYFSVAAHAENLPSDKKHRKLFLFTGVDAQFHFQHTQLFSIIFWTNSIFSCPRLIQRYYYLV